LLSRAKRPERIGSLEELLPIGAPRILAVARCEQILEVAGVLVMVQGDPAYAYAPKVVEALEESQSRRVAAVAEH
jgi:hypothetical protein